MRIIDLFCGLKGWSQAFEQEDNEIITVDILEKFRPTIVADIMHLTAKDFKQFGRFDAILASPPCNCFSVASVYRHWKDGKPKDEDTVKAIELVKHTLKLIEDLNPKWWILENPTGMLRKVIGLPAYQISQCQYGRSVMKPTDLWGRLPESFVPKKCKAGSPCHEKASRSAKTGVQGINNSFSNLGSRGKELRAKIPLGLSQAVYQAIKESLSIKIDEDY